MRSVLSAPLALTALCTVLMTAIATATATATVTATATPGTGAWVWSRTRTWMEISNCKDLDTFLVVGGGGCWWVVVVEVWGPEGYLRVKPGGKELHMLCRSPGTRISNPLAVALAPGFHIFKRTPPHPHYTHAASTPATPVYW